MSNPKSIYHGLSVLTGADASQRLAHPLDEVVQIWRTRQSRTVSNYFNDAATGHIYAIKAGHSGIDYFCDIGNDVKAMYGGVVTEVSRNRSYMFVTIRSYTNWHPGGGISRWGFQHFYGHLDYINPEIEPNVPVKKGQVIGRSGNTGGSNWAHLHMGFRAFDRSGRVTTEHCPVEENKTETGLLPFVTVAQRINGNMNFACFLPADNANVPTITHDLLNQGPKKLLSLRTSYVRVPVFTEANAPESSGYNGWLPRNHPLIIPRALIGCYVILEERVRGDYTWYKIRWSGDQDVWVPKERRLIRRKIDAVHVEAASTPSRPSQTVVHTTKSDVEVYPFPSLGETSHLGLPIPNTLGPLRANTGYRIEGTYLDSNYQGYGSQDPVAGRARRRWWQIDLSRDRNFTEASGWVRSDKVNESGPTGRFAPGWPPVPREVEAVVQGAGVQVSWRPWQDPGHTPGNLRVTGYRIERSENSPGFVRGVFHLNVTTANTGGRLAFTDDFEAPPRMLLYYRVAARVGTAVGPASEYELAITPTAISDLPSGPPPRPPLTRVFPKWESVAAAGSVCLPRVGLGQARRERLSPVV